ncbi:anthranilate synthase component I family protein [Parvularcula lutaonensis]|uniref:Anthranilate synthase component I family protein n=1 Tax=Parvularcula lutaonensis TaxID=491923 RepID=A0ABV7MH24_9PROT|nr:anthranilate synthase component I family protein [Parvularcula lutaonensis]GGY55489.1 hypothetical protein GCM10007148_26730 [Parvularcula lutaonensis]
MNGPQPRRVILAAGFSGEAIELSDVRDVWSCDHDELPGARPFEALREAEASLREGDVLAGYFGYECAVEPEPGLDLPPPPLGAPAAWFGVFGRAQRVQDDLPLPEHMPAPLRLDEGDTPEAYAEKAKDVRRRIAAGDVFQVNVSHRQSAEFGGEGRVIDQLPWREALTARFGALLDLGEHAIVSASPELFLALEGRRLATEPIKGTRPRSEDPIEDARLLEDLLADPKDRAENIMIADLMRNDLAKVCADGSIAEPEICGARSLDHVHHLYSRIEGHLREGLLFADALRAAFPCGSVTGAPKLAAMDAIAALEGEGRGAYCGSVFYTDGKRAAASVAIRTAVIDEECRRLDVRSGGGVTILSDPHKEYIEALDKGYLFRMLAGRS